MYEPMSAPPRPHSEDLPMEAEAADPLPAEPEPLDARVAEVAAELVDGVPVLAEVRAIEPAPPAALPVAQAAAVAATSFVAGAATLALVRRHSARKLARGRLLSPRRAIDALPIVGTRSFLVDVHLIGKPEE
jgi:hypothetical protein